MFFRKNTHCTRLNSEELGFLLPEDNLPTKLKVMTLVESGLCEGGGYLWQKRERMPGWVYSLILSERLC